MLIHCVYEAGNPQLAPLLGSYLSMRGNLNLSDLLALQTIFKMEKDGKYACRLDTIDLQTAMPLTDMQELARVIEACPNLGLFVGYYDKMLVEQIINSKLRKFEYCNHHSQSVNTTPRTIIAMIMEFEPVELTLKSINYPVVASTYRFYVWSRIGSREVLTLQKILYLEEHDAMALCTPLHCCIQAVKTSNF